jgi:mRNA guanylyltransferase
LKKAQKQRERRKKVRENKKKQDQCPPSPTNSTASNFSTFSDFSTTSSRKRPNDGGSNPRGGKRNKLSLDAAQQIVEAMTEKYWGTRRQKRENPQEAIRRFLHNCEEELQKFVGNAAVGEDTEGAVAQRAQVAAKFEVEVRLGLLMMKHPNLPAHARVGPQAKGVAMGGEVIERDQVVPLHSGCSVVFVPGVSTKTFADIKQQWNKRAGASVTRRQTEARSYDANTLPGHAAATRAEMDVASRAVTLQSKLAVAHLDLHLPTCDYDLRVSVVSEETAGGDTFLESMLPETWKILRHKDRVSYENGECSGGSSGGEGGESMWRLDLTNAKTEVHYSTLPPKVSHEVELELTSAACQQWLLNPSGNVNVDGMVAQLWSGCLECILPPDHVRKVGVTRVEDVMLVANCKEACFAVYPHRHFPGSMPTSFHRHHLPDIQNNVVEYFVSEKSDGVRYILAVSETDQGAGGQKRKGAVFFNRAFKKGFHVEGLNSLCAEALPCGTLLDGEIVYNRSLDILQFVVFDILAYGTEVLLAKPYMDRQEYIEGVVNQIEMLPASDSTHKVLQKKFHPRKRLRDVFQRITLQNDGHIFREDDGLPRGRHHKTDGIIFQPNTPYVCGTDQNLLKWKWSELCSIDFQVTLDTKARTDDKCLRFECASAEKTFINFTKHIRMDTFDRARLLGDMLGKNKTVVIAELTFQTDTGKWAYVQLRTDKGLPNYFHTVVATIMEMAEGVNEDELQYRMLCANSNEDEWDALTGPSARSLAKEIIEKKKDLMGDDYYS